MKIQKVTCAIMREMVEEAHKSAIIKLKAEYKSESSREVIEKVDRILKVEFSERMSTRGGVAMLRRIGRDYEFALIRLNFRLLKLHPEELVPTYLHELAHVVANFMTGRNEGHGAYWGMVMFLLGLPADRCHKMDVSSLARAPKRYTYKCVKCPKTYSLTPHKHARHNRAIDAGTWGYRCKCGGDITLSASEA